MITVALLMEVLAVFDLNPIIVLIFGLFALHWLLGLLGAFRIHDVYRDDPVSEHFAELYWLLSSFGVVVFGFLMLSSYFLLPAPKRE